MARIPIEFVGQAYEMPAKQLDAERCVNWYITYSKTGKFSSALLPTPGLEIFSEGDASDHSVRGLFELNDTLYAVVDAHFYIIDDNGQRILKGTLTSASGAVKMVPNDEQIFISDGAHGYIYQLVTTATRTAGDFFEITDATSFISDPVFTGAGIDDMTTGGTYIGTANKQYVVEIDYAGTGGVADRFRWSNTNGSTWNTSHVTITGLDQTIEEGITVNFQHTTGHTLNDKWAFSTTIDSAFYVPIIPAYQDGYGVYVKQESDRWYISKLDDFSEVNALDYAVANAWPDDLVAAISIREELWLIGRQTAEVWYDTGASLFPFERRTGLIVKYGCDAPYTVTVADNNILFWLGRNEEGARVVIALEGYEAKVISTEAINAEMMEYEDVRDAIAFSHQWQGHMFYTIIFPTADRCWCFDMTTQAWHERRSRIYNELPHTNEYRQARWRANCFAYYKNHHLVGDFVSGDIFNLSASTYTENGTPIICERITKVAQSNLDRLFCDSLQVDMQAGTGLTVDQGSDPQVMLQVSRDGGMTWGNELWRSSGKIGEYTHRAKWNHLGSGRSFVFKLKTSDPVYRVVLGAVADMQDSGS